MRLQCPNCDAEYEVDANAIPYEGRDVQCSNCGHGWFQAHPDYETDYEFESALYDPPPPLPQGGDVSAAMPKRELDPEAQRILREEVVREEALRAAEQPPRPSPEAAPAAEPAPEPASPPTNTDFDIESALDAQEFGGRADNETGKGEQRSADSPTEMPNDIEAALDSAHDAGVTSNPDPVFDLRDNDTPQLPAEMAAMPATEGMAPRAAPRRVARIKGLTAIAKAEADPLPPAGDFGAPSPEAIPMDTAASGGFGLGLDNGNASDGDLRADMGAPAAPRKSGRRAGFYSAILIALGGAASYVTAPDLAAKLPALAPALDSYTQWINALRDQVQGGVPQAMDFATGLLATAKGWLAAQGWM
ncbi:MAG: zinc-ribbon domain-containing protein [Cypionkella sp.]|nr:zinc-ribbon domain-containing protein [Cypionkella sp.]